MDSHDAEWEILLDMENTRQHKLTLMNTYVECPECYCKELFLSDWKIDYSRKGESICKKCNHEFDWEVFL